MRFLHTADWHLGRLFHGLHLTEDQACVLDRFVELVRHTRPDFILLAGDLYDRAIPPPEAIELLDDVLCRLVIGERVPVIAIAGNHDSPQRVRFCSRLLAGQGLHISGACDLHSPPIEFEDACGTVRVCPIPFAEPCLARQWLEREDIHTHHEAMAALAARMREQGGPARRILVAHAFVAGGTESESERPLSVGGSAAVERSCFDGFQYVALGHLHFPHSVHAEHVRYAGSLLKYSFSEAEHRKSVSLVEMDGEGGCRVEPIALPPRRDLRRISGRLDELLTPPAGQPGREDYLEITLLDEDAVFDAMGRLRRVYPNVLHIQRAVLSRTGSVETADRDHRRIGDRELFASFYRQVAGGELSAEQDAAFVAVADQVRQAEREAVA